MKFINFEHKNLTWCSYKLSKIDNKSELIKSHYEGIIDFFENDSDFFEIGEDVNLVKIKAIKNDNRLFSIYRYWDKETINNSAIIYYFGSKYAKYDGLIIKNLSTETLLNIKKSLRYIQSDEKDNKSINNIQANIITPKILPFYLSKKKIFFSAEQIIIEEKLI